MDWGTAYDLGQIVIGTKPLRHPWPIPFGFLLTPFFVDQMGRADFAHLLLIVALLRRFGNDQALTALNKIAWKDTMPKQILLEARRAIRSIEYRKYAPVVIKVLAYSD
jgi:hypothetical protein